MYTFMYTYVCVLYSTIYLAYYFNMALYGCTQYWQGTHVCMDMYTHAHCLGYSLGLFYICILLMECYNTFGTFEGIYTILESLGVYIPVKHLSTLFSTCMYWGVKTLIYSYKIYSSLIIYRVYLHFTLNGL